MKLIFRTPLDLQRTLGQQTQADILDWGEPKRRLVGFLAITPERHRTISEPILLTTLGIQSEFATSLIFLDEIPETVVFAIDVLNLRSFPTCRLATLADRQKWAFFHSHPRGVKGKDVDIAARRELGLLPPV